MLQEEYRRITNLYLDDIYRVAYSGCQNRQDAEDVTQEVFEALLKYKGEFENDEHAKFWLIKVTTNKCKSMWRTPWKRRVDLSDEELPVVKQSWTKDQEELYIALRKLPLKYAQCVHLYYFEEMKTREIAEQLGISETAVSTRLQRAREKLKIFLGEETINERNVNNGYI